MLITRFAGTAPWEADLRLLPGGRGRRLGDHCRHDGDRPGRRACIQVTRTGKRSAAFTIALDALKAAGATAERVVRTRMYVTDMTPKKSWPCSSGTLRQYPSGGDDGRGGPACRSCPSD